MGLFKVTNAMKREATQIKIFVEKTGRLPKQLPGWVDYRGIDGVVDATKLQEARQVNREIFRSVRTNQIDDYVPSSLKGIRSLPVETGRKLRFARLSRQSIRLLGRTCVAVSVAAICYDGYRLHNGQVTLLDLAEEQLEALLTAVEFANYPTLLVDQKLEKATGIDDPLQYLNHIVESPVNYPSPEETQEAVVQIRKLVNKLRKSDVVKDVDKKATDSVRRTIHDNAGTPKNAFRTVLLGPMEGPTAPWPLRLLLDKVIPKDEYKNPNK